MDPSEFKKIGKTNKVNTTFGRTKAMLYLGLGLLINRHIGAFTDECSKFELDKIQALSYRRTNRHLLNLIVWFLILALMIFFTYVAFTVNNPFGFFVLSISIIVLIVFIFEIYQGPSVDVYVTTAVGFYQLSALGRLKQIKAAYPQIIEAIEKSQGAFDRENVKENLESYFDLVSRAPKKTSKGRKKKVSKK